MSGRIVRTELRRSAALGTALLAVVAGTALLLSFPEGFAGRWVQLATTTRMLLIAWCPLALAAGAWIGQRDARSRVGELFTSTARPRWRRVLPTAAALALALVTAYAVTFLVGAAWVIPTAGHFPAAAPAIAAVGALSLVAAGWLGLAAGRAVPRLVTPALLAVAGFALLGFLPDWQYSVHTTADQPVPPALLLVPVYSGQFDDIETVTTPVTLLQALWLAAVAATAVLLLGTSRRRATAWAVLPAVLGAAGTVALLPDRYSEAVTVDPAAAAHICDDGGPPVCVTRVHAGLLPEVVGPAREVLATLAAKLPDAPGRAVESSQVASWAWSYPTPAPAWSSRDTLVFPTLPIGPNGQVAISDDLLRENMLESAWWADCSGRPLPPDVSLARAIGVGWLTGQPPAAQPWWPPEERDRMQQAHRTLTALPPDEQAHRMARMRDAVLECHPDALRPIVTADTS